MRPIYKGTTNHTNPSPNSFCNKFWLPFTLLQSDTVQQVVEYIILKSTIAFGLDDFRKNQAAIQKTNLSFTLNNEKYIKT